ncbi:hypothetical protein, partial [Nocardia abscessus]|uniref:hypothetical protein n=1 Tax=Nocardia abscessus TaxID=120957 RepID=UPI001C3F1DB0
MLRLRVGARRGRRFERRLAFSHRTRVGTQPRGQVIEPPRYRVFEFGETVEGALSAPIQIRARPAQQIIELLIDSTVQLIEFGERSVRIVSRGRRRSGVDQRMGLRLFGFALLVFRTRSGLRVRRVLRTVTCPVPTRTAGRRARFALGAHDAGLLRHGSLAITRLVGLVGLTLTRGGRWILRRLLRTTIGARHTALTFAGPVGPILTHR